MLNLILFGAPGSGKGTQATSLVKKYNLYHISTGDMFRYEITEGTPLGMEAKNYMDKGELVPDSVTIGMLRARVEQNTDVKGFIFDGFPRNEVQAAALDELLESLNTSITCLLELDVPESEIIGRILKRGEQSGRADDKDENIIRNRFKVYEKQTTTVAAYYATFGKAYKLNGVGTIEQIFLSLSKTIDEVSVSY
ncbi:MAG: adenylate kinase [Bacteroidota bacterium]|jgi:adenylate kinase